MKDYDKLSYELNRIQIEVMQNKIPVIIIFEGYSAAGKGTLIGKTIGAMDPRAYRVISAFPSSPEKRRYVFLQDFFQSIPEYGKMSIFNNSWYTLLAFDKIKHELPEREINNQLKYINIFERQLSDDGCIIIKFFLNIDKSEQKERFNKLLSKKNTSFQVTSNDKFQNRHFSKFKSAYNNFIADTNSDFAPWHIIDGKSKDDAVSQVFLIITERIKSSLQSRKNTKAKIYLGEDINILPIKKLSEFDFLDNMDRAEYSEKLKYLQNKLKKLHAKLYLKKIPVIVGFEGWDAAGKGGVIHRFGGALDPRGSEVVPIAAPTEPDKKHHYLWRFWNNLPKTGHIVIFDRTWYGRVLVERVEGFSERSEWLRAYGEINEFEDYLVLSNNLVLKFFLNIDKDEQLKRFNARQNSPDKEWKITEEDWRNREKWDLYEAAIDDMLKYTNTSGVPWHVVSSNDKYASRIEILNTICRAIERRLDSD